MGEAGEGGSAASSGGPGTPVPSPPPGTFGAQSSGTSFDDLPVEIRLKCLASCTWQTLSRVACANRSTKALVSGGAAGMSGSAGVHCLCSGQLEGGSPRRGRASRLYNQRCPLVCWELFP